MVEVAQSRFVADRGESGHIERGTNLRAAAPDVAATAREAIYSDALDQLTRLQALVKQGRAYLEKEQERRYQTAHELAADLRRYLDGLGLLGDELGHGTPPLPPTNIDLIHHYFPETGHTVAFEFLSFYNNDGGLDIFGYPIAEFTFENGYYIQYFQRAKMVWHPEMSGNDRMQLADLGSIHFDVARLPIELKNSTGAALVGNDAPIKVTASVLSPVTGRSGRQTLFVFVTDAQDANVAGVNVSFSVHPVSRPAPFTVIGQTNSDGFISSTFAVDGSNLGQPIIIEVRAVAGTASGATEISYLPWY